MGSAGSTNNGCVNYDEVFSKSFDRVLGTGAFRPDLIRDFYELFLETSPFVRETFAETDMAAQRTMLHDSLLMLVDFYQTRKTTPRLQRLAEIHSRTERNIPPDFYDLWLDSLIEAISRYDDQFDDRVNASWRIALAPGITFMKFAY